MICVDKKSKGHDKGLRGHSSMISRLDDTESRLDMEEFDAKVA